MHSINFTATKRNFIKVCTIMEQIVIYLLNGTEIYKFKAKDSEIVASTFCLGIVSKDWTVHNMKRQD